MGGPSGWGPDKLITGLLVSGVQLRVTGYRIIFLIRLRAEDTTILLTPVNISTRSFQASVFLRFWALLLKAGYGCRITNRQTSININTDWAAMTNLRDTGATSGPGHTGDHSQPIVWCQDRVAEEVFLSSQSGPGQGSSHRTNGRIWWFTASRGGGGLFSIISDKFVPFPVPHQSWPEEGHQNRLSIRTFHQNLSPRRIHVARAAVFTQLTGPTDVMRKTFEFWKNALSFLLSEQ